MAVQYRFDKVDKMQNFATRWSWNCIHKPPHMALGWFTPEQRLAMVRSVSAFDDCKNEVITVKKVPPLIRKQWLKNLMYMVELR